MQVAQALNLILLLLQQIVPAVRDSRDTIEITELGDEHREALDELRTYLDTKA